MNKCIFPMVVIATALVTSASGFDPSTSPTATPTATGRPVIMGACRYNSWSPELYLFYGSKDIILNKLQKIPETAPFSERRVFVQLTQGVTGQIKLFERKDDGTMTVTEWTRKKVGPLVCQINDRIIENKGTDCVGEKVKKALVEILGKPNTTTQSIPAPQNAADAFSPSVNWASGEYPWTGVWLLC